MPAELTGTGAGGQISRKDVEDYLARRNAPAGKIKATPAARRVAGEIQVDLHSVKGTGPEGRIQAADVSAYKKSSDAQRTGGGFPGILRKSRLSVCAV